MLQDRLILNRFMYSQFGCSKFEQARELLKRQSEGYSEDGHSNFYHAIKGLSGMQVPEDQLAQYDVHIREYLTRLQLLRDPGLSLKHYQYLAILFSEHYLHCLFEEPDGLLAALNCLVAEENAKTDPDAWFQPFDSPDLTKLAFWMATGSGKTLVMHMNYWQYLRYCPATVHPENVLLITPNEGLSKQHRQELGKSDIRVRDLGSPAMELVGSGLPVTVIEITKLTKAKKGGGESIDIGSFGDRNLLLVDEGHRGASGELWRELRMMASRKGFTFEYSATFGEIVNGASPERRTRLLGEYSKAILFDYSYPHFHRDGYGKDYWITNIGNNGLEFNRQMMVGNLLSFYEQCLAFEEHRETARAYNLEKPLWVFVDHSVTRGKTQEDQKSLTDVGQIVSFLADFLARPVEWQGVIESILKGGSGLVDANKEDLFSELFPYLRRKFPTSGEIYEDIVVRIFQARPGDTIRVAELHNSSGELGIRAGADAPYFAVINVGDAPGLVKVLEIDGLLSVKDTTSSSLFEDLNKLSSKINILIGSRKFMEGWDCFRVSSMGLMNLGRGEGAQIIQLFGRGVRLWGKDRSLKRSEALTNRKPPDEIRVLETLGVFGIRADYMAKFREYVAREGIAVQYREETLPIKVSSSFLGCKLSMLESPESEFSQSEVVFLKVDSRISVKLDLFQRADLVQTDSGDFQVVQKFRQQIATEGLHKLAGMLCWDRIMLELLKFKASKNLSNIVFNTEVLRTILEVGEFEIEGPIDALTIRTLNDLRKAEEIAIVLLKKYTLKYYERKRREWEQSRVRVGRLTNGHPNLTFQYQLRLRQPIGELVIDALRNVDAIYDRDSAAIPSVHFDRHLYQPLLLLDWNEQILMTPTGLNEGERIFVEQLRQYCRDGEPKLEGKSLYLLRNLTRGKGICFFESLEGEAFYPDFILWVMEDGIERMAFIDPHGLCHVSSGFDDPKLSLHKTIKTLEKNLQSMSASRLVLSSFILSTTRYEYARKAFRREQPSKEQFEEHNVLFIEDGIGCIDKLFGRLLSD